LPEIESGAVTVTNATLDANAGDLHAEEPSRRDFIYIATGAFAAVGGAATAWMLIDQMNPAADTLALATSEVDLSQIAEGSEITVKWRGTPVFVRHRTPANIEASREVDILTLRDPQTDDERLIPDDSGVLHPEYLVMRGTCTHLGCVPLGNGQGDFGGWFCPCHGSHYDTAGRIRLGPAPKNLEIPTYKWLSGTVIQIG
jgi:ubiquinol-cytochrome c reductase iron-sulfur subunit